MKIKNNYTSRLGFGAARILPGETVDTSSLPKGYNENHPLIKFYISNGWLKAVGDPDEKTKNTSAVDVNVSVNGGENGENNGGGKSVDRMNLEELKALSADMGLQVEETDTRKILIEKIKAAQKGAE
jgi:hypothetical protein